MRAILAIALVGLAAPALSQQSLDGRLDSGLQGGLSSGLGAGGLQSGLMGTLGTMQQGRTRAQTSDVTLGGTGTFSLGALRGQPSNFGPTFQSTGPLSGSTLDIGSGPEAPLDMGAGPAGPLD